MDTKEKIIRILAEKAPLSGYKLAREAGISDTYAYNLLKKLEKENIVSKIHQERWRTGLTTYRYILTFKGLIHSFSDSVDQQHTRRRALSDDAIHEIIKKYAQYYNYPIFTEWDFLEDRLGKKVYSLILSASWLLRREPGFFPINTKWISGTFSTIINSLKKNEILISTEEEDKIWIHGLSLIFLSFIQPGEEITPTPNQTLYNFAKQTLTELKDAMMKDLSHIEKMKRAFESQFGEKQRRNNP